MTDHYKFPACRPFAMFTVLAQGLLCKNTSGPFFIPFRVAQNMSVSNAFTLYIGMTSKKIRIFFGFFQLQKGMHFGMKWVPFSNLFIQNQFRFRLYSLEINEQKKRDYDTFKKLQNAFKILTQVRILDTGILIILCFFFSIYFFKTQRSFCMPASDDFYFK